MLMFDIPPNYLRRYFVSHTSDKIAVVPQFSTPQWLLHLRKLLKYHPGRNTFHPLHDLGGTIARWGRKKYMHMIVHDFLGIDLKTISLGNLLRNPLQPMGHSLSQDQPPIFGTPHHLIFEIVNGSSGSLEAHASKNIRLSPLCGLVPFLPPASWGVSRSSFL